MVRVRDHKTDLLRSTSGGQGERPVDVLHIQTTGNGRPYALLVHRILHDSSTRPLQRCFGHRSNCIALSSYNSLASDALHHKRPHSVSFMKNND